MVHGEKPCDNFDWPYLSHYLINCKTWHIKVGFQNTTILIVPVQLRLDQKLKRFIPKTKLDRNLNIYVKNCVGQIRV